MCIKYVGAMGLMLALVACTHKRNDEGDKRESNKEQKTKEESAPGDGRVVAADETSKNSGYDKASAFKEVTGEILQHSMVIWKSENKEGLRQNTIVLRQRGPIKLNETYEITPSSKLENDSKGPYLVGNQVINDDKPDISGTVIYTQIEKVLKCKLDLKLADGRRILLSVETWLGEAWVPK